MKLNVPKSVLYYFLNHCIKLELMISHVSESELVALTNASRKVQPKISLESIPVKYICQI